MSNSNVTANQITINARQQAEVVRVATRCAKAEVSNATAITAMLLGFGYVLGQSLTGKAYESIATIWADTTAPILDIKHESALTNFRRACKALGFTKLQTEDAKRQAAARREQTKADKAKAAKKESKNRADLLTAAIVRALPLMDPTSEAYAILAPMVPASKAVADKVAA